jgi:two-component system sensor histidine kinase UhpB
VDRKAVRRALSADSDYTFSVIEADTGAQGLQLARAEKPDCILLDYHLPDMSGLEILAELANDHADLPPVVKLTGTDDVAVAVEAMRRGARDYLVKDGDGQYLKLLPTVIKRVLAEEFALRGRRQAESKYRSLVEQIPAITYIAALDAPNKLLYISPQAQLLGFAPEVWLADPDIRLRQTHPDDQARVLEQFERSRLSGEPLRCEYRMFTLGGRVLWFSDRASVVRDESGERLFLQGVMTNITSAKQREELLLESRELMRNLARHQVGVREEERSRIARDVHDELGQKLTALQMEVSMLSARYHDDPPELSQKLRSVLGLIDATMDSVRAIAADLRPPVLDLGLVPAIEWQVQEFQRRTGVPCELAVGDDDIELEEERATAVFRMLQEALTNVARHANATQVEITLNVQDGTLQLTVEDNGVGMPTRQPSGKSSFGLLGLRERALMAGGDIRIDSRPGRTTLRVTLPMTRAAMEDRQA